MRSLMVAAALAAATITPATAATSHGSVPNFRGTVTITASQSYTLLVALPRATSVDIADNDMTGQGREYGFVLRRVGAGPLQPVFLSLKSGHCASTACGSEGVFGVNADFGNGQGGTSGVLPAGTYRLYVVADGRPVVMHVNLGSGSTRITHGTPWKPHLVQPAASDAGPLLTTYAAGATVHTMGEGGLVHLVSWKTLIAPDSVNDVGLCQRAGTSAWFGKPYQAPCTTDNPTTGIVAGESAINNDGPAGTSSEYLSDYEMVGLATPGTFDLGAFNDGETPATDAHTQIVWIDFSRN